MQKFFIGTLILVVALIAVGLLFSMDTQRSQTNTASSTEETQAENGSNDHTDTVFGPVEGWQGFVNQSLTQDWAVTIKLPSVVQTSNPQDGIYSFKYVGPESEPQTEITDGFLITLSAQTNTSVSEYLQNNDASTGTETITFNGNDAVRYQMNSALGNSVTHTVFILDDDSTVIDIAEAYYGERSGQYEIAGELMLSTLLFSPDNTSLSDTSDLIQVDVPSNDDTVSSPVTVSGQARGQWFFEATAPVNITNWDGLIIGEGFIEAEGDWMTTDFVPFSGEITYTQEPDSYSATGTVIFMRANPSGLPENDAAVEVTVQLEDNSN